MDHLKMCFLLTTGDFPIAMVVYPAGRLQAVILAHLRFDPRQDAHLTPTRPYPSGIRGFPHSTQTSVLSKVVEYQTWMATNRENLGTLPERLPTKFANIDITRTILYNTMHTYNVVTSPELLEYPFQQYLIFPIAVIHLSMKNNLGQEFHPLTSLNPLAFAKISLEFPWDISNGPKSQTCCPQVLRQRNLPFLLNPGNLRHALFFTNLD